MLMNTKLWFNIKSNLSAKGMLYGVPARPPQHVLA
jgi:hypothetical protein